MSERFTANYRIFLALLILLLALLILSCGAIAQTDQERVKETMNSYNKGIQSLSPDGLSYLLAEDSEVFESGGSEGTFRPYLERHLSSELEEFKSIPFSDYSINVEVIRIHH